MKLPSQQELFRLEVEREAARHQRYATGLALVGLVVSPQLAPDKLEELDKLVVGTLRDTDVICRIDQNRWVLLAPHCDEACGKVLARRLEEVIFRNNPPCMKRTCVVGTTSTKSVVPDALLADLFGQMKTDPFV